MFRVSNRVASLRTLLLAVAMAAALLAGMALEQSATARNRLPQESPLSPLATAVEETSPLPAEARPPALEVLPAPLATSEVVRTLPLGEPLRAETSLYLVGLVLAGLLGTVVLLVVQQRRR